MYMSSPVVLSDGEIRMQAREAVDRIMGEVGEPPPEPFSWARKLGGRWISGPVAWETTRRWRRIHKRALKALKAYLDGNRNVLGGALKP